MDIDAEKLEQTVLALLYFNSCDDKRRPRFLVRKVPEYNQRLPSTRFVEKKGDLR
jgi:hypothetical protein